MHTLRFALALFWGAMFVIFAGLAPTARAQTSEELSALSTQVQQLRTAGKYQEAMPLAENYVTGGSLVGHDRK